MPEEYHLSKVRRRRDTKTSDTAFWNAFQSQNEAKVQNLNNETVSAFQESSIEKDYKESQEKMGFKISSVETASDWNNDNVEDNEIDEESLEVDTKMDQEVVGSDDAPLEGNSYKTKTSAAENVLVERYSEDDIRKILDSDSEEDY